MSVEEKPETAAQRLTDALIGRVTRYMTTYRLSQRQLAIHLGMSQAGLSLFLNQRRRPCNSIGFYERVCAVVGCTFGELVADVEANGRKAAAAAAAVAEPPREAPAAPLPTPSPTPPPTPPLDTKLAAIDQRAAAGIAKVRIIDADGTELIAVRRRNLTPEQKRQLAMYDNRAAEFSEWDPTQIGADLSAGLDLAPFFRPNELKSIVQPHAEAIVTEVETSAVADRFWISIRGPLEHQAVTLQRLREATQELAGVEVELGTIATLEEWKAS